VTYSNSISVAEHAVMQILVLVRNFVPAHSWAVSGGWNIADSVSQSYDVEGMDVGIIAAGRIGQAVMRRLAPFDVHLHYFDTRRLPADVEQEFGLTYHEDVSSLVRAVDVVSIHAPLHPQTYHMFDADLIASMSRGSYIVNTARAEIVVRDAVVAALESGQLGGSGPLRRRNSRNLGGLPGRASDPRRVPHRGWRQPCRNRSPVIYRRQFRQSGK
jgi:formate dehydrogenase